MRQVSNKLDNYQTRDVGTKVAIEKLKSCFNQIDAIRDKAQLISPPLPAGLAQLSAADCANTPRAVCLEWAAFLRMCE